MEQTQQNRKMRVLHVITSLQKGGAEKLLIDMAHRFQERGVEVKIALINDKNDFKKLSQGLDIVHCPSYVYPKILKKNDANLKAFLDLVNDFKPNIIHTHLLEAEMLAREVTFPNIKYVTHWHGQYKSVIRRNFLKTLKKKDLTDRVVVDRLVKKYKEIDNHFIAVSEDLKRFIIKNMDIPEKMISVLHNAVDLEKFRRGPKKSGVGEQVKLITIGGMSESKAQDFLIEVMKLYKDEGKSNVSLDIIGNGQLMPYLQGKVKEYGLEEQVNFIGYIDKPEDYLAKADIYVHSAKREGFGLVLIEAMACGLPVVTTDGGGNAEIIEEGKNGFLIRERNVAAFKAKVDELIANKELYKAMSNNAEVYSKQFDIKDYAEKLVGLYKYLLK